MKIVIDIPKEVYEDCRDYIVDKDQCYPYSDFMLREIIRNGTVLPKGHGRLLILDEAEAKKCFTNFDFSSLNWISEVAISMVTLKILEADKEDNNETLA